MVAVEYMHIWPYLGWLYTVLGGKRDCFSGDETSRMKDFCNLFGPRRSRCCTTIFFLCRSKIWPGTRSKFLPIIFCAYIRVAVRMQNRSEFNFPTSPLCSWNIFWEIVPAMISQTLYYHPIYAPFVTLICKIKLRLALLKLTRRRLRAKLPATLVHYLYADSHSKKLCLALPKLTCWRLRPKLPATLVHQSNKICE